MRWLFKTEPTDYSYQQLVKDGKTTWDGVKNALALIHLRAVKKGDEVAVYHTGDVKAVVGLAKAAGSASKDSVQLVPVRTLSPVSLASIKADPRFKDFALVRQGRLSVMPVPDELWGRLIGR